MRTLQHEREDYQLDVIPRILKNAVLWYLVIWISTYLLSSVHMLRPQAIILVHALFLFCSYLYWRYAPNVRWYPIPLVALGLYILFGFLTYIQGLMSAPNNADSMIYHLPRIMYWLENKSVYQNLLLTAHDYTGPFGEYIMLHFYALGNSDRFVFMSQWIAYMLIPLAAISLLRIRKTLPSNIAAVAVLTLTIPMAVAQAVTTQTDLIAGLFIALGFYFAYLWRKTKSIKDGMFLAICLGFSILTKQSSFLFIIPAMMIVGVTLWQRRSDRIQTVFLVGGIAALMNMPFSLQLFGLYGSFFPNHGASESGAQLVNEIISVGSIISNTLRNTFLHVPVPFFQNAMMHRIELLHMWLGISASDSRTTWTGTRFALIPVPYPHEDLIGAPIHLLLFSISIGFLCFRRVQNILRDRLLVYSSFGGVIISFILFSTVFKWQPWNARLQLPLSIIASFGIASIMNPQKIWAQCILGVSTIFALMVICFSVLRPYISYSMFNEQLNIFQSPLSQVPVSIFFQPREKQYFNSAPFWYEPYKTIAGHLANVPPGSTVSFHLADGFEYPLWVMLKSRNEKLIVLSHGNASDYVIESVVAEDTRQIQDAIKCEPTVPAFGYVCLEKGKEVVR